MMRKPTTIIAEAAQGYEGDPTLGLMLVRAAAAAGADLVKFQLVIADEIATKDYLHYDLFTKLEMKPEEWWRVSRAASDCGLGIAFDVYGARSLSQALELGAHAVKIHTTDFFNDELLADAISRAPRLYLSVGGIEVSEIKTAFGRHDGFAGKTTLMFGHQSEPTLVTDNNLSRLAAMRREFPTQTLGFMDHSDGSQEIAGWLAVLALPYGVVAIEKHLSLDRELRLEDYVSALAPAPFKKFVSRIKAAESALGIEDLGLSEVEQEYRRKALKVVTSRCGLPRSHLINSKDIILLRAPVQDGRTPIEQKKDAVGRTTTIDIPAGAAVCEEDLL